jgi:hypothetical protein
MQDEIPDPANRALSSDHSQARLRDSLQGAPAAVRLTFTADLDIYRNPEFAVVLLVGVLRNSAVSGDLQKQGMGAVDGFRRPGQVRLELNSAVDIDMLG